MLARRPRGRFALGDLDGADSDLAAARIVLRVELHLLAFTQPADAGADRKSTRLNSSHSQISYAVFCLKKKKKNAPHVPLHSSASSTHPTHGPPPYSPFTAASQRRTCHGRPSSRNTCQHLQRSCTETL